MKISKLSLAFATCILSVTANASSIDNISSKKGYNYVVTYDKDMSSISIMLPCHCSKDIVP